MSILLPGNLSGRHSLGREGQKNELPLPDSWFPPECQPDIGEWTSGVGVNTKTNLATEGKHKNITTSASNPYASLELDQYGTELAKEARVWKVYVKETDAWDTELVEGWNRSLDVILIFAALFSAISTAFIIESTKGLQGDPTDIASQTLLQISQTLYAIANNSIPVQSSQPTNETQEFVPSRPLLLVNILWYLSLSLSIATSFLAILAKDWCHSFMAHRSGHPCIQARRRQRKWTMIERWKMQELLAVLPLLIHIALLLFAIGLCIYVWELNVTVALPIVCVTGAVITFYATSTVAATLLDSFPYTTIVSRILGSELLKYLYAFVAVVAFCLTCVPTAFLFYGLISVGERWEKLSSKHLQRWEKSFGNFGNDFIDWIGRVPWTRSSEAPCHDMVTSQALSWLIKHCEVPEAVDIALQAIAGANARLPRKPLKDCGASVALSRHIASGNLPKGQRVNEQYMSLYLRALSYLGANDSPGNTGEIEVMIWDLQAENERSVSALITDGKFTPEDHNIAALRIDSMAPPQCLSLLKSSDQDGKDVFDPIVPLLQQHADKTRTLHPASRLALVNAVTMLCACVPSSTVPDNFAGLSIQIFYNDPQYWGDDLDLGFRLIAIALLQGRPSDSDYLGIYSDVTSLHAPHVFQMLLAHQLTDRRTLEQFIWFGVLEILSTPAQYNIDISQEIGYQKVMTEALGRTSSMLETLPLPINHDVAPRSATRLALPIIRSLDWIYTTSLVGVPDPNVYMFVVECMLCVRDNQMDELCWSLMSTFCFPSLSMKLLKYLDERALILVFQKHLDSDYAEMQFFAATQLWLLFTLYIDPPVETAPELDLTKLLVLLEQSSVLRNDKLNIHQAKEKLGERIEELEAEIDWEEGPPIIYGLRVLECVLQSRDHPLSDQRWERIDSVLAKTPRRLRGLGSFTPLPMRQPYALDLLSKGEHISIPLDNENSELEEVANT